MTSYQSPWLKDELVLFQQSARKFYNQELVPHEERWAKQGFVDRDAWRKAGDIGLLCASIPEEYGGSSGDIRHEAVVFGEHGYAAISALMGITAHSIVAHYILALGTKAQKERWLPRLASGEFVAAIGMSEPGGGSDLRGIKSFAKKTETGYSLSGSKTFITNGYHANLVMVAAKTAIDSNPKNISLLLVETDDCEGYQVGKVLDKIGHKAQDTAELFFQDVQVPQENLLGDEGYGLNHMMRELPYERLILGFMGLGVIERAVSDTVAYTKERQAFGKAIMDFQNTRFTLAECQTEAHIARVFLDSCIERYLAGNFDATTASMAKYWVTDKQVSITDRCLQLFGGYGYMTEYPIARLYADSRVQKIYGGTNEIMKELIARSL